MFEREYILGTAQFGMDYGIANSSGQPTQEKANEILASAWKAGARGFDTAQGYAVSESVLGVALAAAGVCDLAKVYSKLDPACDCNEFGWIEKKAQESLRRLGIRQLEAMLLHRYSWLEMWDEGLGQALVGLREKGLCRKVGVSVYDLEQLHMSFEIDQVDMVQISSNLWSPQLLLDRCVEQYGAQDQEITVRSIFLQGLLLMEPQAVKAKLPFAYEASREWHGICTEFGSTPFELCLRYAAALECPVIVGADSAQQAENNGRVLTVEPLSVDDVRGISQQLKPYLTDRIINPARWGE